MNEGLERVVWPVGKYFCIGVLTFFVLTIAAYVVTHPFKTGLFILALFVFGILSVLLGLAVYKVSEYVL